MTYVRLTKEEKAYLQSMTTWLEQARQSHNAMMQSLPPTVIHRLQDALNRQADLYNHLERVVQIALRVGIR